MLSRSREAGVGRHEEGIGRRKVRIGWRIVCTRRLDVGFGRHGILCVVLMLAGMPGATASMFPYGAVPARAEAQPSVPYSERMVLSHGKEWTADKGWDYVSGLVAKSVLRFTDSYPYSPAAAEAYGWCRRFADQAIDSQGKFYNFKQGSLDNIAAGKVLLSLYVREQAEGRDGTKYRAAAEYLYDYLRYDYTRITLDGAEGGFIHKNSYPYQMWLDGLFMGAAFYAEYQALFDPDDKEAWDDIALQFDILHTHTYDAEEKLNYHAWSAKPTDANSFWANRSEPFKGCSREFWGRGMGWYAAALVDVLEVMPATLEAYDTMRGIFAEVMEGIAERQDEVSGVWYQLLRYDDSFVSVQGRSNYLEASASCMFTYALLKGLRLGLLDENTYRAIAEKAYAGLLETFVSEGKSTVNTSAGEVSAIDIHRICRSAGLGPASNPGRDGSADYYLDGSDVNIVSNEGKGIGSFILASLEYERAQAGGEGGDLDNSGDNDRPGETEHPDESADSTDLRELDADSLSEGDVRWFDAAGREVTAPSAPGFYWKVSPKGSTKYILCGK